MLDAAAASLATIRAQLSPDDKQLLDDLASARAQLAKLTVAGPSATGEAELTRKEVAALEDQIQKLEIPIGQKSAAYRAASQPIDARRGAEGDPEGRAARRDRQLPAVRSRRHRTRRPRRRCRRGDYAAYVAGPTGDPMLVDLGPAAAIDDAIEEVSQGAVGSRTTIAPPTSATRCTR